MPEPKTSKGVVGDAVAIPNLLLVSSKNRFELSCVKAPEAPIKGTEPKVNAVVIDHVATEPTKVIVPSNPFASLKTNELITLGDNIT